MPPSEKALSLRRVILTLTRLKIENNPNSGQILAQAKLSHLDESDSRSSEIGSPRRDLAQRQGMSFWCFLSGESCSLKRKYQIPNLFSHATVHESSIIQSYSRLHSLSTDTTLNHAIQRHQNDFYMKFKQNN